MLINDMEFSFTTQNYMKLQRALNAKNLRLALLEAAHNGDYEVLALGIKQFAQGDKFKKIDEAYAVIDGVDDKQTLFYEFISELGENGFFNKATPSELREMASEPNIDMNKVIEKVFPDAAKEMLQSRMMTGVNTSMT